MTQERQRTSPPRPGPPVAIASLVTIVGLLLGPGASGTALAQTSDTAPLVTDRPDATESAVSVAAGRYQLEAGYTVTRAESRTLHSLGEGLLRVGLTDRAELRLGFNSFQVDVHEGEDTSGLEDASVGTKVVLHPEASGAAPRIAVLGHLTLPTGSEEFGSDGVQPDAMLALGWDLSPRVDLGANFGYTYADDETGRFDQLRSSLALGLGLSETTGLFLEYFADHRPADERPSEVSANGGLTLLLTPDLQLDLRGGLGLNSAAPDHLVGAGVSIRR